MKKQQLSSVIEFDKDLNDVKKPNAITSKICQNDMVNELIADWYGNIFDEFEVFKVDYIPYLVWYVYNKRPNLKEMNKRSFIQYLCKQPKDSIPYMLYKSFRERKKIYKKDMERMLFLLIDEINPLKINRNKTTKANNAKHKEDNEFRKFLEDFHKQAISHEKMSFDKFFKRYENTIRDKIKQSFPKIAKKIDDNYDLLYSKCKNIIYNRKK